MVAANNPSMFMAQFIFRRPTVWMLFQCVGGNRWSSPSEDCSMEPCGFSGCKCHGKVTHVKSTTDLDEAHDWFHRAKK